MYSLLLLFSYGFPLEERTVDPGRLVQAYFHSAATSNYVRAQLSSGVADLHNPMDWGLGHVRDEELQRKYQTIVTSITESLRFMRTIGADTAGPRGGARPNKRSMEGDAGYASPIVADDRRGKAEKGVVLVELSCFFVIV